ncbi:MAG: Xaa-Pro peptidase family protein [Planctomycetaceae bacterium]
MTAPINLTPECSRHRQSRLLARMRQRQLDRVILQEPENVQWLTGFRPHRLMSAAASLDADGRCVLAAPNSPPDAVAVDDCATFEAQWLCTLRQEQPTDACRVLATAISLDRGNSRIGIEGAYATVADDDGRMVDIAPELWRLRRRKDPDELALIRRAIDCTAAMYAAAREHIRAGITELELFNILQAAAVTAAGEPLTHPLGNDFQCNSPGGPPRSRPAQKGELFVLDLGPSYRGYYADNCRTICVGGQPSEAQLTAWKEIVAALRYVEETVRPGVRCQTVYSEVKARLDRVRPGSFFHHLGHGIGLFPHEAPHLNPRWDDIFEEGDVFAAEPALYGDDLRAGIRLEENFRVTVTGVEKLTHIPLEL